MIEWHPHADKQIIQGKAGKSTHGSHKPVLILHTTETGDHGWPHYSSPPHLTLDPLADKLRQHVPFDHASYAIYNSAAEEQSHVWQVEIIGRANDVPNYGDNWYGPVAKLLKWFHDNMGVPAVFADFSTMRYGRTAPQRFSQAEWAAFSGFMGHAHAPDPGHAPGERHYDPGMLNVAKVKALMNVTEEPQHAPHHDAPEHRLFPDVPDDHIFAGDIAWLKASKITGVPAGHNFEPDDDLTRGEFAALLHRFDRYLKGDV